MNPKQNKKNDDDEFYNTQVLSLGTIALLCVVFVQ